MTLNYLVIVERYGPFIEWSGWQFEKTMKPSLYLMEITSDVGRKPRAHPLQGRQ